MIEDSQNSIKLLSVIIRKRVLESLRRIFTLRFTLWFLVALIYTFTCSFDFSGPNTGSRYALIKAIAETGNTYFPEEWLTGIWIEPDRFNIGDKFFSDKAPGISLLMVPLHFLAQNIISFLCINPGTKIFSNTDGLALALIQISLSLINAWGVVRVFDITKHLTKNPRNSLYTALIIAFGTIFWLFSPTLFPHALVTTFILEATLRLFYAQQNKNPKLNYMIIGLLLGYGGVIDYGIILIVPLFCLYIMFPISTMQKINLKKLKEEGFKSSKYLFQEDTPLKRISQCFIVGLFSIIGFLPLLFYNFVSFGDFLSLSYDNSGWSVHFYTPLHIGLEVLLTSNFRGIITFSPIILLSIFGFALFYKKLEKEALFMVSMALFLIFFYAKYFTPEGGTIFGPRYIIPALPFLLIPIAFIMEFWDEYSVLKFITIIFSLFSGLFTFLGLFSFRSGPLIFNYDPHPIFDICWNNFLKFLNGDSELFYPKLVKLIPLTFFIVPILAVFLLISLLNIVNNAERESKAIFIQNNDITAVQQKETIFWFVFYNFILYITFYFILAPFLSEKYDNRLLYLQQFGIDTSDYIQPINSLTNMPFSDFLLLILLLSLFLITLYSLIKKIVQNFQQTQ